MTDAKKRPVKAEFDLGPTTIGPASKQPPISKKKGYEVPTGYLVIRLLTRSDNGELVRPGAISKLEWITDMANIEFLLERGRVIKTDKIKLCHLPGWKRNSVGLEAIGILTPAEYLNAISAGEFERLTQAILIDKAGLEILADRLVRLFETAQTPDHEILNFEAG